jgi:hypothetical protein
LQAADWADSFSASIDGIAAELMALERSDTARAVLDLRRMGSLLQKFPRDVSRGVPQEFLNVLGTGITVGRFIRWVESGSCMPSQDDQPPFSGSLCSSN